MNDKAVLAVSRRCGAGAIASGAQHLVACRALPLGESDEEE